MAQARWGSLVAAAVAAVVGGACSAPAKRPASEASTANVRPEPASRHEIQLAAGAAFDDAANGLPAHGALVARAGDSAIGHLALDESLCERVSGLGGGCRFVRVLGQDGRWGQPVSVDQTWASLSEGREGVYGSRVDAPLALDFIDRQGNARLVYDETGVPLREVTVVEANSGLFVFGQELPSEDGLYTDTPLSMQFLERRAAGYVSSARKHLPMAMSGSLGTARDARHLARRARRVGYGQWAFSPALDATGAPTDQVLLVWTEVKAPRKAPPPQWGEVGRSKHACKAVWRTMMMGCASSRSLSDESVKRVTRATLIARDGRIVKDVVVPALPPIEVDGQGDGAGPAVVVQAMPGGWLINGHRFDAQLSKQEALDVPAQVRLPSWDVGRAETLVAMAFSDEAGEGVVVVEQAGAVTHATEPSGSASFPRRLLRRFDAQGAWLGEPDPLEGRGLTEQASLVRLADGWRTSTFAFLCSPTGLAQCRAFAIDAEGAAWCGPASGRALLPDANPPTRMFFRGACAPPAVYAMSIDVAGFRYHSPVELLPHGSIDSVARDAAGRTWALLVSAGGEGTYVIDVDRPEARGSVHAQGATLHRTGKHVVLREQGEGGRLIWLGTGVEIPAPKFTTDVARREDGTQPVAGPLLPDGASLLGDTPGELLELPAAITAQTRRCEQSVRTRDGTVILLCIEPAPDALHLPQVVLRRLDE